MKTDTDLLIENLKTTTNDRRFAFLSSQALSFYYVAVAALVVFVFLMAPTGITLSFTRILIAALGITSAYFAAVTAVFSAIPGKLKIQQPLQCVGSLVVWIVADEVIQQHFVYAGTFEAGLPCSSKVLAILCVPALVLIVIVQKAAPMRATYSTFFALLSAGIVANVCMRMWCASDSVLHDLIFHVAPCAIVITLLSKGIGFFFSWDRKINKMKDRVSVHRSANAR